MHDSMAHSLFLVQDLCYKFCLSSERIYFTSTLSGDVMRFYTDNRSTGMKGGRHYARLTKEQDEYQGAGGQQIGHRGSLSDVGNLRVVGDHLLPCELAPERARPFFQR